MGKIKDLFSKEKRVKTIAIIAGAIVVIAAVVCLILFGPFNKSKRIEKKLTNRMQELGKDFYENYYYDQVGKDFVKNYENNGIKVDLNNLARLNSNDSDAILGEFKNAKGESCNANNTKVTIYPKDPYEKTNYEIKVTLDCNLQ